MQLGENPATADVAVLQMPFGGGPPPSTLGCVRAKYRQRKQEY